MSGLGGVLRICSEENENQSKTSCLKMSDESVKEKLQGIQMMVGLHSNTIMCVLSDGKMKELREKSFVFLWFGVQGFI